MLRGMIVGVVVGLDPGAHRLKHQRVVLAGDRHVALCPQDWFAQGDLGDRAFDELGILRCVGVEDKGLPARVVSVKVFV